VAPPCSRPGRALDPERVYCSRQLGEGNVERRQAVGTRQRKHAQGFRQSGGAGANGARAGSVLRPCVLLSRPRGDLVKLLWWDGDGLCLFAKRLERGRFVWPRAEEGVAVLSRAQLSMLLEGIDWRMPQRTWRPELAG